MEDKKRKKNKKLSTVDTDNNISKKAVTPSAMCPPPVTRM